MMELDHTAPSHRDINTIQVIELHMMDTKRYYPLTMASGFVVRGILYPLSLIKTRIQVQKHKAVYSGTFDAFLKISTSEGAKGLYRGFWISNLQVVPQMCYITTYENVRRYLAEHSSFSNSKVRSFIAGGCASLVGQTFVVPIDIVSQYLMMIGLGAGANDKSTVAVIHTALLKDKENSSRLRAVNVIVTTLYKREGLRGFWKGYLASLSIYAPNSAMWWFFYDTYCTGLAGISPIWVPHLVLQCVSAMCGGMTASLITNPLDIIRARIQLGRSKFVPVTKALWKEERLGIFTKGLSARLITSVAFSFFIILGYESIKRWSLLDEYKDTVRW